jgi:hypothetical protein
MRYLPFAFAIAVGLAAAGTAAGQGRHDEKPHGMTATPASATASAQPSVTAADPSARTIMLKDGTTLVAHTDGTMYHADAKGKRIKMKDGVVMEGQDGTKYPMKNDVLWQAVSQKGSLHPNHQ